MRSALVAQITSEIWVLKCLSEVLLSTHKISFGGSDNVENLDLS